MVSEEFRRICIWLFLAYEVTRKLLIGEIFKTQLKLHGEEDKRQGMLAYLNDWYLMEEIRYVIYSGQQSIMWYAKFKDIFPCIIHIMMAIYHLFLTALLLLYNLFEVQVESHQLLRVSGNYYLQFFFKKILI